MLVEADELGAGVAADGLGAGVLISGDLAGGGAGWAAAGGDDGAGEGGVPSAAAAPIIKPVMAVVTMSFFSIVVSLEIRMEHRNPPAQAGTTRPPGDMFRLCRKVGDNENEKGVPRERGAARALFRVPHSRLPKLLALQTIP